MRSSGQLFWTCWPSSAEHTATSLSAIYTSFPILRIYNTTLSFHWFCASLQSCVSRFKTAESFACLHLVLEVHLSFATLSLFTSLPPSLPPPSLPPFPPPSHQDESSDGGDYDPEADGDEEDDDLIPSDDGEGGGEEDVPSAKRQKVSEPGTQQKSAQPEN